MEIVEDCVPEIVNEVDVHESEVPVKVSFIVGESFESFEELEKKVNEYEQCNSVQLWKRDTRTIRAAQKRLNRSLNERIKYYEIVYACIHGGKKFTSIGTGKRVGSS
jgi:hypothetical protein